MLSKRVPFLIERRHMLWPPVIRKMLQPELLHHRRPLLGAPLLRIEGDDAPGNEFVATEEFLCAGSHVGLLDDQDAVHQLPMAGEGAEIGIAARCPGGSEVDRLPLARLGDIGVGDHIVGLRHIVTGHCLWIGDELVGQRADGSKRAGLHQHPVVGNDVGIDEGDRDRLTGLHTQFPRLVGEVLGRLDRDGTRLLDRLEPLIFHRRLHHRHVAQDRMCSDCLRDRAVAWNVAKRFGEGVDRGEYVAGFADPDGDVDVQLVHRLQVGHLEEEALAIGEHGGRTDGDRVMARRSVVAR